MKRIRFLFFICIAFSGLSQDKVISKESSDTIVRDELQYEGDTIKNYRSREGEHFLGKINFFSAVVLEAVNFSDANFSEEVDFRNSILSGAYFENSLFSKYADFEKAMFLYSPDFKEAHFFGEVNFEDATFSSGYPRFIKVIFSEYADFSETAFNDDVEFDGATFLKDADFSGATFSQQAFFEDVRFSKNGLFNNLVLKDSTEFIFSKTIFPDTLDFSYNSHIYTPIDLTNANFTDSSRYNYKDNTVKPVFINLYRTDISKIHLDYVHYKLLLLDSADDNFDRKIHVANDENEGMYQALLANFKAHGQEESYKLCDIEYQQFKWSHSWASFLPCIPYYWNHFGYDKQFVFYWTFWFIIGFTILTCIMIEYLNTEVYKVENIPPSFKNFGNRLWFSFIYTSTVFFRLTLKIENIKFERKAGTAYLILMYTIGLVCLAYMANFVLQK